MSPMNREERERGERTVGRGPIRERRQLVEKLVDTARREQSQVTLGAVALGRRTHRPIVSSLTLPLPHLPRLSSHRATSRPMHPEPSPAAALVDAAAFHRENEPRLAP